MLESGRKDFPQRWVDISEACAMGATRAHVDLWIQQGRIYVLMLGSSCWYSYEPIEQILAGDAAERMGGPAEPKDYRNELPECSKAGNLHR
jgi:hypothetical protein